MKLLFICTHNRCRSILAEAITNHLSNGRIKAASAGSSPQSAVHPKSLEYLHAHNIATDGLISQSWDEFERFKPDAILTLCDSAAQETCPVWFDHATQVHWGLEDPSKTPLDEVQQHQSFNKTIHILERRIKTLLNSDLDHLRSNQLKSKLQEIAVQIH